MGVPAIPLTELYNRAGDYIRARGGEIRLRTSLESFCSKSSGVTVRITDRGAEKQGDAATEESFDYLILALPFNTLAQVLPQTAESASLREHLTHFESCPITGIHLWFDREISGLDHAVLLDRTVQWMFHKSRLLTARAARERHDFSRAVKVNLQSGASAPTASYIELVVSASKSLIDKSRAEIVDLALQEVREFFPAARDAVLIKSAVIKEVHATYSPRPGLEAHRPSQTTSWPRVFLAGDWTATGWPATMEGAVRSGYLASEALTQAAGIKSPRFISEDLPASGLMRLFR